MLAKVLEWGRLHGGPEFVWGTTVSLANLATAEASTALPCSLSSLSSITQAVVWGFGEHGDVKESEYR